MLIFGTNKNKLALLFFANQIVKTQEEIPTDQILQKKIIIEVTDDNLATLDKAHNDILAIKARHDFSNLHTFLKSLEKTVGVIEGSEGMDATALAKALSGVSVSSFFKQTEMITKLNLLNNRDDAFILRFENIVVVT